MPAIALAINRENERTRLLGLNEESKRVHDASMWKKLMGKYATAIKLQIDTTGISFQERLQQMKKHNPKFVLRNWIAQRAIEKAEKLDFTEVNKVLGYCRDPFDVNDNLIEEEYSVGPPRGLPPICVSCSS